MATGSADMVPVASAGAHMEEAFERELWAVDNGITPNVPPEFLRASLSRFPRTGALLAGKARIPFGVTVTFFPTHEMDEEDVPEELRVPEVTGAIVRCRRCRAYLNPGVEVVEGGYRWRCNLCFVANDFPGGYDAHAGPDAHPELHRWVCDFVNAPVEYTVEGVPQK